MTSSVLPSVSLKVTVVTDPLSPLSSLVQTRRECGVTSMCFPKNSVVEASCLNTRRYLPPVRISASSDSRHMPIDFGTHHCLSSSGRVHASNTRRAGPLKVRVTTSSRSDFRSTVVRFVVGVVSISLCSTIDFFLSFQCLDNRVQRLEPCAPEMVVSLDPRCRFLQSTHAERAGPHAPDLLRGDEARLFQDADVLLHSRERHVKLLGQIRDRRVCTAELLENAASRGVGECGEGGVEGGVGILNHVVQYTRGPTARKRRLRVRLAAIAHCQMIGASQRDLSARRRSGAGCARCRRHSLGEGPHEQLVDRLLAVVTERPGTSAREVWVGDDRRG